MLKILQIATVCQVVLVTLIGAIVVFLFPENAEAYVKVAGVISPLIGGQIACAFFGKPLKDVVTVARAKIEGGK